MQAIKDTYQQLHKQRSTLCLRNRLKILEYSCFLLGRLVLTLLRLDSEALWSSYGCRKTALRATLVSSTTRSVPAQQGLNPSRHWLSKAISIHTVLPQRFLQAQFTPKLMYKMHKAHHYCNVSVQQWILNIMHILQKRLICKIFHSKLRNWMFLAMTVLCFHTHCCKVSNEVYSINALGYSPVALPVQSELYFCNQSKKEEKKSNPKKQEKRKSASLLS